RSRRAGDRRHSDAAVVAGRVDRGVGRHRLPSARHRIGRRRHHRGDSGVLLFPVLDRDPGGPSGAIGRKLSSSRLRRAAAAGDSLWRVREHGHSAGLAAAGDGVESGLDCCRDDPRTHRRRRCRHPAGAPGPGLCGNAGALHAAGCPGLQAGAVTMTITAIAALGGLGFVLLAIAVNVLYGRNGLPLPTAGGNLDETAKAFASAGPALRRSAVLAPASWLCLTIFAAGLLSQLWEAAADPSSRAWALVGLSGVLLQNATFACIEALRFAVAEGALRARSTVGGLWTLSIALFGFNQVFLATALLGFTIAGVSSGLVPVWHAVV